VAIQFEETVFGKNRECKDEKKKKNSGLEQNG
jgi:hypothetical protein